LKKLPSTYYLNGHFIIISLFLRFGKKSLFKTPLMKEDKEDLFTQAVTEYITLIARALGACLYNFCVHGGGVERPLVGPWTPIKRCSTNPPLQVNVLRPVC
jgi:hypothetical protein